MPMSSTDHHEQAAHHHDCAAEHHRAAGKACGCGDHKTAAEEAQCACGHTSKASHHADMAAEQHIDKHDTAHASAAAHK